MVSFTKFMKLISVAGVVCALLFFSDSSFAQDNKGYSEYKRGKNDTIPVALTRIEGELIPWIPLSDVFVFEKRLFKDPVDRAKFYRLRYNVLRVLPYARFARERYEQLQRDLATASGRRDQKRLNRTFEKEIKDMFNREIKELTITQGKILVKLIDRETGTTSYDLVKQLKGGFTAFFYQSIARVVGHDLKDEYDPQQDRDIESIIESSGYYRYN